MHLPNPESRYRIPNNALQFLVDKCGHALWLTTDTLPRITLFDSLCLEWFINLVLLLPSWLDLRCTSTTTLSLNFPVYKSWRLSLLYSKTTFFLLDLLSLVSCAYFVYGVSSHSSLAVLLMALNLLLIGFAAWSIVSTSVRDLPVGSIMALLISPLLLGAILRLFIRAVISCFISKDAFFQWCSCLLSSQTFHGSCQVRTHLDHHSLSVEN